MSQRRARKPMPPGREAVRPARAQRDVALADASTGRGIVVASIGASAVLAITTVLAAVDIDALAVPALVVALTMFFGGTAALIWSYFVALGRSREVEIDLAGLYGLSGSAPTPVRVRLIGAAVAQLVIASGGIAVHPYSSLAFGFLAVMWGIGLIGMWGARHGAFPPRAARS
ncbi:MAG: hypothetical protein ACYDH6_05950 [Acidimicrobiales bacterium]